MTAPWWQIEGDSPLAARSRRAKHGCNLCDERGTVAIGTVRLGEQCLARLADIAGLTVDDLRREYADRPTLTGRPRPRTRTSERPHIPRRAPDAHAMRCERCGDVFETRGYITKHCPDCRVIVKRENRRLSKRRVTARRQAATARRAA